MGYTFIGTKEDVTEYAKWLAVVNADVISLIDDYTSMDINKYINNKEDEIVKLSNKHGANVVLIKRMIRAHVTSINNAVKEITNKRLPKKDSCKTVRCKFKNILSCIKDNLW